MNFFEVPPADLSRAEFKTSLPSDGKVFERSHVPGGGTPPPRPGTPPRASPTAERDLPSVLDLATVADGTTKADAVNRAVALAQRAENLGYTRFWTAEHHSMPMIASSTPDLVALRIADTTTRLRVGAGGVMLPNHSPLQVAERYLTLKAFHPGRIDLGVGRAPGTDPLASAALRRSDAVSYPEQLRRRHTAPER